MSLHLPTLAARTLSPGERAIMWSHWIGTGLLLDLAAYLAIHRVPVIGADPPASAAAIALLWVNNFVLPCLLSRRSRRSWTLLSGTATALLAVPAALACAFVTGLLVFVASLSIMVAIGPGEDYVARMSVSPVVQDVQSVLGWIIVATPTAGGAVAALVAGGIAAAVPFLRAPLPSLRMAAGGAWAATVLFVPDWQLRWLIDPWRTPALLLAAALPPLVLVSWRDVARRG